MHCFNPAQPSASVVMSRMEQRSAQSWTYTFLLPSNNTKLLILLAKLQTTARQHKPQQHHSQAMHQTHHIANLLLCFAMGESGQQVLLAFYVCNNTSKLMLLLLCKSDQQSCEHSPVALHFIHCRSVFINRRHITIHCTCAAT